MLRAVSVPGVGEALTDVRGTVQWWIGNTVGYTAMLLAVMANPADFAARVYRNVRHYVGG